MNARRLIGGLAGALCLAAVTAAAPALAQAPAVAIDADDIGGVVRGPNGPEAGVWVIAETTDLPTRFARSVVTDDQGRYVVPDLPGASYRVWVRGYGLVDSPKQTARPGQQLNLTATPAPNAAAAAQYYPAIYWYTMMKIPPASDFGPNAKSGIPANITRDNWLRQMSNVDCVGCHQLGNLGTRKVPEAFLKEAGGKHADAWMRRIQSGQSGEMMVNRIAGQFGGVPFQYFGDWTERIAKGELPKHTPPRPSGIERNVVVTTWAWSTPDKYLHDLIASDRRYPTVNANGPLYGSPEYSTDQMPVLDPKTSNVTYYKMPVRDEAMPVSLGPGHAGAVKPTAPSPYWGEQILWDTKANNHNAMFGKDGRVWIAASVRGMDNPAFCKKDGSHPSAKLFPLNQSPRQVAVYNPKDNTYKFIDTCFGTHHPQFGYDADNTLWLSGTGQVAGWVNTKVFDETGSAEKAQGWHPFVLDINGNGKLDDGWTEPGKPEDGKDMRLNPGSGPYAVMPHPTDGSVWYTTGVFGGAPGFLRFDPKTRLAEIYTMPKPGIGIRGGDIDKNGVLWGSGSGGHLVSFDRAKCKAPLNGPAATGNHCPEGWAFHRYPGPGFEGEESSAEASYYTWVDHHNTLGLGENVPISTANLQDGFVALKDGRMVLLQVPYPQGYYAKGLDGRIDDPGAGWKGRALWSASGDRTPWLGEGGKGQTPLAVKIQVRPDPLAK